MSWGGGGGVWVGVCVCGGGCVGGGGLYLEGLIHGGLIFGIL